MIVSTDYRFLRLGTWQGELSRAEVFNRFPDKRSWWIDSSGEVFDAGSDHDAFVKNRPDLFDTDEGDTTYYAVRKLWVRVSAWGPSFTINSRDINQKQLDAAQMLYMREGGGKRVEFFQDNVIPASFDKEEFLELKNVNKLKRMRSRLAATNIRCWWINPAGKIYDAGTNHTVFVMENAELFLLNHDEIDEFKSDPAFYAMMYLWVRVSDWGQIFLIESSNINQKQLDSTQMLYMREGGGKKVEFFQGSQVPASFDKEEFLELKNVNQLKRLRNRIGSSLSSRAWYISPEGQVIDCGQSHGACMRDRPEVFGNVQDEMTLIQMGWIRVGDLGGYTFIDCDRMTAKQLDKSQDLVGRIPHETVEIIKKDRITKMTRGEFLSLNSPGAINRRRAANSKILLSPDCKSLRVARSPSDTMKEEYPDKRSWWVNPDGKIFDVGHDHNKFLEERPKTFGKWADINKALTLNWIRVAFWGGEFVVHCHSINRAQIKACQQIYKSLGGEHRIYIATLNKYGYISNHDFIWADSASDWIRNLFADATGIRGARRRVGNGDRAWLVSPDGEVINCGYDHEVFVLDHKDFFRGIGYNITSSYQLVKDGWARIGLLGPLLYLDCERLNDIFFKAMKDFTKKLEQAGRVKIGDKVIDRREFLSMDDPIELKFWPSVESRRRSSLPKSRNFLMGVSLEEIPWPLRRAFDLLGLSGKKDKLSANQVVSVFQANDSFLQDHVGRTAVELIRDLNAMFQYGLPDKKVI